MAMPGFTTAQSLVISSDQNFLFIAGLMADNTPAPD